MRIEAGRILCWFGRHDLYYPYAQHFGDYTQVFCFRCLNGWDGEVRRAELKKP